MQTKKQRTQYTPPRKFLRKERNVLFAKKKTEFFFKKKKKKEKRQNAFLAKKKKQKIQKQNKTKKNEKHLSLYNSVLFYGTTINIFLNPYYILHTYY